MNRHVFVYGTLRPEHGRSGWAGACEVAPAQRGSVPGRLYMGPGYPYALHIPDAPSRVIGDVLTCDADHEMFEYMRRVELGAGYFEREVEVTLEAGGTLLAVMYVATARVARYLEDALEITTGDWFDVPDAVYEYLYEQRRAFRVGG